MAVDRDVHGKHVVRLDAPHQRSFLHLDGKSLTRLARKMPHKHPATVDDRNPATSNIYYILYTIVHHSYSFW